MGVLPLCKDAVSIFCGSSRLALVTLSPFDQNELRKCPPTYSFLQVTHDEIEAGKDGFMPFCSIIINSLCRLFLNDIILSIFMNILTGLLSDDSVFSILTIRPPCISCRVHNSCVKTDQRKIFLTQIDKPWDNLAAKSTSCFFPWRNFKHYSLQQPVEFIPYIFQVCQNFTGYFLSSLKFLLPFFPSILLKSLFLSRQGAVLTSFLVNIMF